MILEAQTWRSNAELISAAFDLHVWPKTWGKAPEVLDMTFGRGLWWEAPFDHGFMLTTHDIRQDGINYCHLPERDNTFDVVAFDPDYIAPGGRQTSTIKEFNDRYGLKGTYETPRDLQRTIDRGVCELARVLKPQGIGLIKCTNYISSGKMWLGEHHTMKTGLNAGLVVEDIFVHISGTGPQPDRGENSRQHHARSNSSRLIVFRKPGRRKKGN